MKTNNKIMFPVGTKVKIKHDFQDKEPLRKKVLIVQHHQTNRDDANLIGETFVDNCLYDENYVYVGPFGNWEIELATGDEK